MKSLFLFCSLIISFAFYAQNPPAMEEVQSSKITQILDSDAEFPGGQLAMEKFIIDHIVYPKSEIIKSEEGKVTLSIVIEKDGAINDIKVLKGTSEAFEKEAIRVVESMPKWKPGTTNGKVVETNVIIPINFILDGDDDEEKERKYYDGQWAGIELGTLILMNDFFKRDFASTPYWKNKIALSNTFSFNFFEFKAPIFKQYIGITTGLGWNVTTLSFSNNYDLMHNDSSVYAVSNASQSYRSNTLYVQYLKLPLLLDFSTKMEQKKSFYFAAGVVGGVRIYSNTYQSGKYANGDRFKNYVRSKYNLAPFTLEVTARMGYGAIGLFASYNLTPLFQKDKTVAVYPFRAGFTFNIDYFTDEK
jgi:TonB family protein